MRNPIGFIFGCSSLALVACASNSAVSSPPAVDAGSDAAAAAPLDVRFDTYNVGLAGSFVPNEVTRRPAFLEAVAAYDTEVLCLEEVWFQSDKDAIAAAVKSRLPYAASFKTDLDTAVSDTRDGTGSVQNAFTTPPCTGDNAASLEAGLDCLKDNCSTIAGSLDGMATTTECAKSKCAGSAASLLFADDKRCYGCFAATLPSSTFNEMKTECEQNPHGGLFAKGQNGVMLLSKYPLRNVEQVVFPSTWIRRTALKATATLPNGAEVDAYCTHLTSYFSDTTFYPYTGQFGAGETNGWLAEQKLEAQQLVSFVQAKSASCRAVILGDMNATRDDMAHGIGDATVPAYGGPTLDVLSSAFTEAVASNYTPACTFCQSNHNTDGDENSWLDHIYLSHFPAGSTVSTKRTFDTDVADGQRRDATGAHTVAGKVPLSDHYGLQSTVTVAP